MAEPSLRDRIAFALDELDTGPTDQRTLAATLRAVVDEHSTTAPGAEPTCLGCATRTLVTVARGLGLRLPGLVPS